MAYHTLPLFHFLLVFHPSFLVQLSLREISRGNYFDQQFQMQSFPPISSLFIPTQSAWCHFLPCLYYLSLSFSPSSSLHFESNFPFFLHRLLQEIVPGGVEEVRVTGWLWGRSMICVCVLCVPRLFCCTFKFPQSGVSACHLGGKAGSPQYKEQSKHKPRISAASNWCTISPCRSCQPAVVWIENSLWWFPLLHWHSFAPWLLLPMRQHALIFQAQTLGTVLNNKVLVTYSQMCFWQMYNAVCLQSSMCLSSMFDPQRAGLVTKGSCCLRRGWHKSHHASVFTLITVSNISQEPNDDYCQKSDMVCQYNPCIMFLLIRSDATLKRKKESHSPDAHMLCIQPHWSSLEQVPYPPLQRSRHETAADYGWMRPAVGS